MAKDNNWSITLSNFYTGFSPLWSVNSLTEVGGGGHASAMTNCDVLSDGLLTQGMGLANLTNGTQAGAVSELINFILDKAVSDGVTYGVGATKLYKITPSAITSDGTWPHTITNATDGESCIDMNGALYYFYNKSSGGDIGKYDLSSTFDDDWGSTTPTGAAALQKAPHPVAVKEDRMIFGNGQYVGYYNSSNNVINLSKLDFKTGSEVADVVFSGNQWLIAVNTGTSGTNRNQASVYLYDGAATSAILADEVGVGFQKIGWLYQVNGIVYIAYQDLSSTWGYKIGYINGRQIKPLASFTGSLPNFAQKTLYKNTILFLSSGSVYSAGAIHEELPFQISQLMDGGYATCGAIACPFGTPLIASTDGATNYKIAKASGYDTACSWKSIVFPISKGRVKGYIDEISVLTNSLGANARADISIEYNQAVSTSTAQSITGSAVSRHIFREAIQGVEDFRVALSWANGNTTNPAKIREITIKGHYYEI